jgi:ribose-phosphate pyrophosphokinase
MYIISGSASQTVAQGLSDEMGIPLVHTTSKRFPDDEFYVRLLDDISGDDVIIVQTTYPDNNIVELFLLQNVVKEADAQTVTVVIPYMGYARQDKKFEEGEPISAQAIARLISLHADKVVTVDPHKEHVLNFFNVPAFSCSAVPEIAKYLKEKNVDFILAPDEGAKEMAEEASTYIPCEYDFLEKTRINGSTVKIKPKKLDVTHRTVAIVDDIISTGGTMATCVKELKKQKAKQVFVACTHGLFVGEALKKLRSAGVDDIIATDTIHSRFSKVKSAPGIVKTISSF